MRTTTWLVIFAATSLCALQAAAQPLAQTWTTSSDFEDAALIYTNVNVTDVPDQLQLNLSGIETPYLWISNTGGDLDESTGRHTITQMASEDGRVIRTIQGYPGDGTVGHQPSRTAVDIDFNCWVAYRGYWSLQSGSWGVNAVARLGAEDAGLDFIFTNDHYQGELGVGFDTWDRPRAVAINADGNVWVGNWDDTNMVLLDPTTGRPLNTYEADLPPWDLATHGAAEWNRPVVGGGNTYGMAVDARGNLWAAQRGSRIGQYDARTGEHIMTYSFSFGTSFYGIAVDLDGNVWAGNWSSHGLVYLPRQAQSGSGELGIEECVAAGGASCLATAARRANPPTSIEAGGVCNRSRGVAVDQAGTVWVNCYDDDKVMQATLDQSGNVVFLGAYGVGDGPLGITATADGNVWSVNYSGGGPNRVGSAQGYTCPNGFNPDTGGTVTRLRGSDGSVIGSYPTCGVNPYTYSDLAGYTLRSVTLRSGFWRQRHDAGGTIDWRRAEWDIVYPSTTELEVQFAASDNPDALDDPGFSWCGPYLVPTDNPGGIDFADIGCDLEGRYFWADIRLFTRNDFLGPVIEEIRLFRECVGTEVEVCDGFDNDCDGLIDGNDPDLVGEGGPCNTGLPGICAQGALQCQSGALACAAVVEPSTEVCDEFGVDEDCDGESNEGVTNACGTCGPAPTEVCNLVDDDCDGFVDEGLRAICIDYEVGPDQCTTFINPVCGGCPAAPPEICGDGEDNNCNGVEDEGVARPCIDYTLGPTHCTVVQACDECPAAPDEACDGEDNNCNSLVDEGVQNVCFNFADCSTYQQCDACPEAPSEDCNGRDDNCDGDIDEGVRNACGQCIDDVPDEVDCDGVDNDCDGDINEGLTNECGFCGDLPREVCDGIDNNCDGVVDEGVSNACGTCGPAPLEVCNGDDDDCDGIIDEGVRNECGTCGPVPPETCDDFDNDCDGETDEGTDPLCDAELLGAVCVSGECALPCFSGECPVGEICVEDYCLTNPCFGVNCDSGFRCVEGECASLCDILTVTCEDDLVCVGGNCVEDVCSNTGCDPEFVCIENECIRDRCFEVECDVDEVCSGGACIADPCLEVECAAGFQCVEGDCVDLCVEVVCGRSERCEDGFCVPDACFEVNCGEDAVCIDGNCVETLCADVTCDIGQVCVAGECFTTRAGGACGAGLSRCGEGLFCYQGTCRDVNDPELADVGIDPNNPGGTGDQQAPASDSCECGATGSAPTTTGVWLLLVGMLFGMRRRWSAGVPPAGQERGRPARSFSDEGV